jgi:hypothetical protein
MEQDQPTRVWRDIAEAVVVAFVDAINAFDTDKLIDLFAQDAHVNDQLRDFWGKDAIGNWLRREVVGAMFTMDVLNAKKHFGDSILTAKVSGDFDKTGLPDPIVLSFIFSVREGKVARLIVLMTHPEESEPEIRKAAL